MRIISILILTSIMFLYAQNGQDEPTEVERKAQENRKIDTQQGTVISTVKEPVGGEDTKQWTSKDWQNNSQTDSSLIGNTSMRTQSMPGMSFGVGGNPNNMTTKGLQEESSLADEPSIHAWTEDTMNNIISSSTSHSSLQAISSDTVKCYISRDIPIRYKCSHTGLLYGDSINGDGFVAKNQCESECYEQYEASEIIEEGSFENVSVSDINLATATQEELDEFLESDAYINETDEAVKKQLKKEFLYKEFETEITLNSIYVLNTITFKNVIQGSHIYMDIFYINKYDTELPLVSAYKLQGEGQIEYPVNQIVKKIKFKVYGGEVDTTALIENISLNYNGGAYICSHLQDLSTRNAGDFAYICPSGKIKTLQKGYKTYKICEDYGTVGDNLDGTFSTAQEANSICKKNYSCKIDVTLMTTTALQNFREGCIQGQSNCEADTCKNLRLTNAMIVDENVFDAGTQPIKTIVSGTQVKGAKRPRILLREDLTFQQRTAQELKDEAYKNMLDGKTFALSEVTVGEDTQESSAYNIGISNSGTYAGSAKRALFWLLKPRAFDVDSGIKKFYSVFDVVVERKVANAEGGSDKIKDRIFYIKTGASDVLKPFARIKDWARNVITEDADGNINYENYILETNSLKFEFFDNTQQKWITHSSSLTAEYFERDEITLTDKPYLRKRIISDIGNLIYFFTGTVKRITKDGPFETKHYTGSFDGTGEVVVKVTNYNFLRDDSQSLTYAQIVEMIENKEIEPIYDSLEYGAMAQDVRDDTGKIAQDIQLYLYGHDNKKTGYARIFPKKEDVGKTGFIYLFAVEE